LTKGLRYASVTGTSMSSFTGAVGLTAAQAGAIRDRLPSNARHSGSRDDRPHVTRRFRSASVREFCRRAPEMAIGLIARPVWTRDAFSACTRLHSGAVFGSFPASHRRTGRRQPTTAHIRTPSRRIVTAQKRQTRQCVCDGARQGRGAGSVNPPAVTGLLLVIGVAIAIAQALTAPAS
jgi:hypothetical protein